METINLPNGLVLTINDLSRRIAADTVKVEVTFQVKIGVREDFFSSPDDHCLLTSIFGDELTYEHRLERSFVPNPEEETVRTELVETFKNTSLNYLSSPNFARKMILSVLRDIKQNPFKYRRPSPDQAD